MRGNMLFHVRPAGGALGFSSDVFIMDAVGGGDMNLGELADLTVANDNELSINVNTHLTRSTLCSACEAAHNSTITRASLLFCAPPDAGQQRGVQEDLESSFHAAQPL